MPVIWSYTGLALDVLAEMSLPLSLADAAVDPFSQQVGVAAVAGVLLDHVDQYRAQRRVRAVPLKALNAQIGGIGSEQATSSRQARQAHTKRPNIGYCRAPQSWLP